MKPKQRVEEEMREKYGDSWVEANDLEKRLDEVDNEISQSDYEVFIKPEEMFQRVFKILWWAFFIVTIALVLYRVFFEDVHVEFNLGGMPLN